MDLLFMLRPHEERLGVQELEGSVEALHLILSILALRLPWGQGIDSPRAVYRILHFPPHVSTLVISQT